MNDSLISRRRLLQSALTGLAAVPAAALVAREAAAAPVLISEDDPAAKALAYLHDVKKVDAAANPTYKKGQICANCIQYTAGAGGEGTCNMFPGKLVKAQGWCKVWVQKPGTTL
ncbi:MAG: High potential iron-sulfur protein [Gammaproteobacteria bacterium]|nr:High potential iron-sulfur protein [Gammaproteobacteria bacterium]